MPRRALLDNRPWLLASLAAGIAFYVLRDSAVPGLYLALLKALGCAFLANYALRRSRTPDGVLLAAVMGISAAADFAIEFSVEGGAAIFFLAHVVAISLYLRHPRPQPTPSQKLTGATLVMVTPLLAWLLARDWLAVVYAVSLGGMAASAWLSLFPRYRVGIGAVLFLASDLLIFSRLGPIDLAPVPDLLIWPLYYFGQFLICTGVIFALRRDHRA